MNRQAAIDAVTAAMGKMTIADLAEQADLDAGTVGDFLAGTRWPRRDSRAAIERVLALPIGSIERIAKGGLAQPSDVSAPGKGVLLDLPDEAIAGMTELQVREARAKAEAAFLSAAAEIKNRDRLD